MPLSVSTGVALQADPGLAEPCADWAREVCSCRWDRGCWSPDCPFVNHPGAITVHCEITRREPQASRTLGLC